MPTLRRDNTSAGFISGNPVLAAGEHGYETDTEASKIGDGVTAWADLPYSGANPTFAALNATYVPALAPTSSIVYDGATGNVTSTTEGGITTTFTYNADGTVNTETRLGKVRTWAYDGSGNPTSSTVV
jgi:YD repeat-containing protein